MYQKFVLIFVFVTLVLVGCTSESKTLSVIPSKADFEDVYLGDSKDIVLTLKNKYGKDISITNLILEGSNDFSIGSSVVTPIDMLKGSEYNLTITFTPISDGTIEGLLRIRHTGATKDKEIKLIGNGVPVARISMSESSFDYQKKIVNKSHTHNFEIENTGTAVLEISDMTFSGLGASAYSITTGDAPVNIQVSQKHTFTVTFAPIAVGTYTADLAITHNAINESVPFLIHFDGEGVLIDPRIVLSVGSTWDFGSVAKTMPATQICEIENTGIDSLDITSAILTTNAEFKIDSVEDSNGNALNFPLKVPINDKIFLAIKFSPTANQPYNDKLTFIHNATNENSPLEIPLNGTGRDEISKTYNFTGAAQQWTVPAGVTSLKVEMYGAEGGSSTATAGIPGLGGKVTATLLVTPGDVLNIYVGGEGGDGSPGVGGTGGWNGGGSGEGWSGSRGGGGGGGASDIRKNGPDLTDRIIVAGSGGGGGHNGSGEAGGHGGGLTGAKGANNYGGGGGTQSAGGAGGDAGLGRVAQPGTLGNGGGAWTASTGGGGGAGYYGGGGGSYEAGGGGSSYTETSAVGPTHAQGVQSGDGKIVITY